MQKDRRLVRMARAMGLATSDDSGEAVAEAIRDMNARLGLPSGLAALGVTGAIYEKIVDGAMADHCHKTNPRLATRADYVAMLEASM
jgi:alcohol dehydrogenase class IV